MALVFQYGSNTSTARLNDSSRLNGDARSLGAVITEDDFEFDFTVWSDGNDCGVSDIVPGGRRKIWGVLYDIPDYLISRQTSGNRRSLDAIEGNRYERVPIRVNYPDGNPVKEEVITYVVKQNERVVGQKTSIDYCRYIIDGLREHDAPNEYINYVKGQMIANNPNIESDINAL